MRVIPAWIPVITFLLSWACGIAIWTILGIRKDRRQLEAARMVSQAYWRHEIQDLKAKILKENK